MKYPNIDAERARLGLTNEEFSKVLGVSRKTVYNWLQNGKIPQWALEKMATLFNQSIDYLLGFSQLENRQFENNRPA